MFHVKHLVLFSFYILKGTQDNVSRETLKTRCCDIQTVKHFIKNTEKL